ncbi:hypothetical protein GCM10022419_131100 [Nonomuraea rosea]|uniref:Group II intron maturase-specific domain-containing protein n=1 Tax=Nonomuraea rosea TaxID=638574 RepID=A0ABP7A1Q8_9ACTN
MGAELQSWRIHLRTTSDLGELARWMDPVLRGCMNYYGKFYWTALNVFRSASTPTWCAGRD